MTRNDLRTLCTALGFAAVVSRDVPLDNQAQRAKSLAKLIEAFCLLECDIDPDPEFAGPAADALGAGQEAV